MREAGRALSLLDGRRSPLGVRGPTHNGGGEGAPLQVRAMFGKKTLSLLVQIYRLGANSTPSGVLHLDYADGYLALGEGLSAGVCFLHPETLKTECALNLRAGDASPANEEPRERRRREARWHGGNLYVRVSRGASVCTLGTQVKHTCCARTI